MALLGFVGYNAAKSGYFDKDAAAVKLTGPTPPGSNNGNPGSQKEDDPESVTSGSSAPLIGWEKASPKRV